MEYSGAGGKLIHEKNQKQKISWHYPFKMLITFLEFLRTVFQSLTPVCLFSVSLYLKIKQNNEKMSTLIILRHFRLFFRQYIFSFFAGAQQQQSNALSIQTSRCSEEQIYNFQDSDNFTDESIIFFRYFLFQAGYTILYRWNGMGRKGNIYYFEK